MIKSILDELTSESSTNGKIAILKQHSNNLIFQQVLLQALSPNIKYYMDSTIPTAITPANPNMTLGEALNEIKDVSSRKVTGGNAVDFARRILCSLSSDDAQVLTKVLAKDLKIGIGTTVVNKVFPKLIPTTPYMGAKAHSDKLVKAILEEGEAKSEIKMDGRYCNGVIEHNGPYLESRTGKPTVLTGCNCCDNA